MASMNDYMTPMQQWGNTGNYGMPSAGPAPLTMFNEPPPVENWMAPFTKPGGVGIPNIGAASIPGLNIQDSAGGGFLSGFIGTKDAPGWGGLAMGAAGGIASAYMGMKQYGLAKETLAENKKQFQMNYDAQKSMTNSRMEDRQRARVASNATAYQSPSDYMTKYGIK